jgi:hypothetical protein
MSPYALLGRLKVGIGKSLSFIEEASFPFYAFDGVVPTVYQDFGLVVILGWGVGLSLFDLAGDNILILFASQGIFEMCSL